MSDRPPYQLTIDGFPGSAFRVHSFTGKEALSAAWSFDLVATAEVSSDVVEQKALGQRASLIFNVGPEPRAFYGVVSAVRVAQVQRAAHSIKYVVRVVPRLWLLKRKKRSRVFQRMRVPDIVTAVLGEAGIVACWQLTRAYPEREYCTQYEETDHAFVRRLLAEAGIFFYFHGGGPVDDAAFAADAVVGAAATVGSAVVGEVAGQGAGALVGAAARMAETLIPGDTVVCADDASGYPPVAGDDAAALAASTAAALAPAVGDALGLGGGLAGAAIGAASAVAGAVIAAATEGGKRAPVLTFLENEEASVTTYDKLTRFSLRNTVRSSAAMFRDYDPDRPMVRLQSKAVSTNPFPPSPFEQAAMAAAAAENAVSTATALAPLPGAVTGAVDTALGVVDEVEQVAGEVGEALGQQVPHEVYEHHSPYLFPKWAWAGDEAPKILRQKRRRASIAEGEGGCSDLAPGHRFALDAHPAPPLDGGYVVTSVEHRGETHHEGGGRWRVYWNQFECAPASMPFVPARPKRESVQVMLTATVVGPPGEEIHVDEKGQIRVQFHWDREGKYDEKSSCWIRVMQPWAGAAWGHQFIPRVGMEVVVTFEGGDPDKPMVLGSVYNGTHPPPFKLPEHKTRSGIRTWSTPRSHGANEISFEDQAGSEQFYIHAQRNYDELVEHDQTSHVRGGRQVQVDRSTRERVGHDASLHVGENVETTVGVDERREVGRHWEGKVGNRKLTVQGETTLTVMKNHALEVHGNRALVVGTPDQRAQSDHYVHGSASLGAAETVVVRGETGLLLVCGDSSIEITPDKIVLKAATVELSPKKTLECSTGGGPSMTMGEDVEILSKKLRVFTESASLEVDKEFKAKGDKIKLGYDATKPDKDKKDAPAETAPLALKFSNYFLVPYANKKYHLMVEGLRFEGQTDGEGGLKQDIPKTARQAMVRLWLDDYPEGRQQHYTVKLHDALPPVDSVLGAKMRLKNLGYHHGTMSEEADEALREAVLEFQEDHRQTHGLEPTGELDGATKGALTEVHGS